MQNIMPLYKRLVIVTGSFGSGKSEFSINLALDYAGKNNDSVSLIDMDLVNTYFRTREVKTFLEKNNIQAVVPMQEIFFSDLPISGPGIKSLINNQNLRVIIDLGGDSIGATPLGSYSAEIINMDHSVLMVVNPFRPFTNDIKSISQMKQDIEKNSRIKITGLISNPNTGVNTDIHHIIKKHNLVKQAAEALDLPLLELVVLEDIYKNNRQVLDKIDLPVRTIKMHLLPQWLIDQQKEDLLWQK